MNPHVLSTQKRFLLKITRATNTVQNVNKSILRCELQYVPIYNVLHNYKIIIGVSFTLCKDEMKQQ